MAVKHAVHILTLYVDVNSYVFIYDATIKILQVPTVQIVT